MTIFFAIMTGLLLGVLLGVIGLGYLYVEIIGPTIQKSTDTMQSCELALGELENRLDKTEVES